MERSKRRSGVVAHRSSFHWQVGERPIRRRPTRWSIRAKQQSRTEMAAGGSTKNHALGGCQRRRSRTSTPSNPPWLGTDMYSITAVVSCQLCDKVPASYALQWRCGRLLTPWLGTLGMASGRTPPRTAATNGAMAALVGPVLDSVRETLIRTSPPAVGDRATSATDGALRPVRSAYADSRSQAANTLRKHGEHGNDRGGCL